VQDGALDRSTACCARRGDEAARKDAATGGHDDHHLIVVVCKRRLAPHTTDFVDAGGPDASAVALVGRRRLTVRCCDCFVLRMLLIRTPNA
jgi:hypothetical protein